MSAKLDHISVHVYDANGEGKLWLMDIRVNNLYVKHERCGRDYTSPGDAITSSRHVINELVKKGAKS